MKTGPELPAPFFVLFALRLFGLIRIDGDGKGPTLRKADALPVLEGDALSKNNSLCHYANPSNKC